MGRILAYDLGTSGVKACLYDEAGRLLTAHYGKYSTLYPVDGYREQRPQDWWNCIRQATNAITKQWGADDIVAIGVSGHSLGVVAVDAWGNLLADTTPIWNDARAVAQADAFFEKVDYREWYEATGNGFPRHLYSLFKQMWWRDMEPELYEKTACFLGSKDYINMKFTGEMATDHSYASGSGAYSLDQKKYIEQYLEYAGIDAGKLPRIAESAEVIGYVMPDVARDLGICSGIPVVAGGVDNACMTLGANCKCGGDAYASLGTSAWVTICTENPSVDFDAKIYTFAHCVPGQYLPSVGIFSSGSSLEWAIHNLFANANPDGNIYDWLAAQVGASVAGANGLFFVPGLAGGSAIDPSPDVRGLLAGIDLKHTQADVVRAIYEGIALHLRCAYNVLACSAPIKEKLLLVGGGAKSAQWRRIYASIFDLPVLKTTVGQDCASLGAAALAAVGVGIWRDYIPLDAVHGEGEFTWPDKEDAYFYQKLLPKYKAVCQITQNIAEITRA